MYLAFFHCSDGLWHLTPCFGGLDSYYSSRVCLCRKISWHGDTGRCAQASCTHDFIANPQGFRWLRWFSISCCFVNQPFLGGLTFQFMVVVCGLLFKSATLVCSEFIGGVRKGGAGGLLWICGAQMVNVLYSTEKDDSKKMDNQDGIQYKMVLNGYQILVNLHQWITNIGW